MFDPTREEIEECIAKNWLTGLYGPLDDFDKEAAIYWFAADHHEGQSSNLYSVLSTSEYKPGPLENGVEDLYMAQAVYDILQEEHYNS